MSDPLALISTRQTPQTEPADPRQQQNDAGGYTFVPDDLARLRRFLTLGSTGGTYYTGERELTRKNAGLVLELARTRTTEVVSSRSVPVTRRTPFSASSSRHERSGIGLLAGTDPIALPTA